MVNHREGDLSPSSKDCVLGQAGAVVPAILTQEAWAYTWERQKEWVQGSSHIYFIHSLGLPVDHKVLGKENSAEGAGFN